LLCELILECTQLLWSGYTHLFLKKSGIWFTRKQQFINAKHNKNNEISSPDKGISSPVMGFQIMK
jgi:hypothetical protein